MRNLTAEEWMLVSGGEETSEDSEGITVYGNRNRGGGGWQSSTWRDYRNRNTTPPPADTGGGGGGDSHDPYYESGSPGGGESPDTKISPPILTAGLGPSDYLPMANDLMQKLTPAEKASMGSMLIAIGAGMEARGSLVGEHIREIGAWIKGNNSVMLAMALGRASESEWVKPNGVYNLPMLSLLNAIIANELARALALPGEN